jgi:hypothetical protein
VNGTPKLNCEQDALLTALLTQLTHAAPAVKAGVGKATLHCSVRLPDFAASYRRALRQVVERAIGRIEESTGQAVDSLLAISMDGKEDNDRIGPHPCSGEA